jgi:hypothetical protein
MAIATISNENSPKVERAPQRKPPPAANLGNQPPIWNFRPQDLEAAPILGTSFPIDRDIFPIGWNVLPNFPVTVPNCGTIFPNIFASLPNFRTIFPNFPARSPIFLAFSPISKSFPQFTEPCRGLKTLKNIKTGQNPTIQTQTHPNRPFSGGQKETVAQRPAK